MSKSSLNTIYLNEYGQAKELTGSGWSYETVAQFEAFLEEVWENRKHSGILSEWYEAEEEPVNQPLLQIKHKRSGKSKLRFEVRASNYVGIIRFKGTTFHLLPKVFQEQKGETALELSNAHLLWWLSYSKKLALPKYLNNLSYRKADFLEILIHLFATYTRNQLKQGAYQTYQEIEEETSYLKGQLVFSEYIPNYLGRANYQKMYCRYDSFEMDNQLNRIIKFVCKWLKEFTQLKESRNTLSEILWMLDEVADVHVSYQHCDQVVLNRMFSNYQMVLSYCKMFLLNSQSTTARSEDDAFAFLLPMEKVFEEFVLGFIQKEVEGVEATGQYSKKYLTEERKVALRPDLHLRNSSGNTFLADTKYKLLYKDFTGISRSDLYQMLAYAVRYKSTTIHLFYPNWQELKNTARETRIKDEFAAEGEVISIYLHALQVIDERVLLKPDQSIQLAFAEVTDHLVMQLTNALSTPTEINKDGTHE